MSLKQRLEPYLPRLAGAYLNLVSMVAPGYAGKKAVHIFTTPRRGRLRPKDVQYLSSFEQPVVPAEGLNIQCYRKGNGGPVILFVHGWESNAARWQPLLQAFEAAGACTLLVMDAPAHGASEGEQFNSLLYGRCMAAICSRFRPDVIIGHSIGAASAVYALTHCEMPLPKYLVLMGSPSDFLDIAENYVQMLRLNKRTQRAMMRQFEKRFGMRPDYYSISAFAERLTVPGLVVHDYKDDICPFTNGERIAAAWKGSELMAVSGMGHGLNHPDVFERIIKRVLN